MLFTPVIRRAAPSFAAAQQRSADHSADHSFQRFFHDAVLSAPAQTGTKGYTVEQDDSAYTLQIDVPGVAREHLSIGIEGTVVRIDSLADAPRSVKAAYELPQDIDASASSARLEHGVLTLKLVKSVPVSKVTPLVIN